MSDGKVDSDVKLYIVEALQSIKDELKVEIRNGHPTSKVGKALQNNVSVIVSTFIMVLSATLVVARDNTEMRIAFTQTLPEKIKTTEERLQTAASNETAMRKQEDASNNEKRAILLKKLEDADDAIARRIDSVVRSCCPKGTEIGFMPGESPTYAVEKIPSEVGAN